MMILEIHLPSNLNFGQNSFFLVPSSSENCERLMPGYSSAFCDNGFGLKKGFRSCGRFLEGVMGMLHLGAK